jgi:hypothetical protein
MGLRLGPPAVLLPLVLATACRSDPIDPVDRCETISLPVTGPAAGPVVVDVGLEVQPGVGIIVVATATDPEGTANLTGVLQSVGVFPDRLCEGTPLVIQDDLAGSGLEETFGTAVDATANAALFNAIAAQSSWPVSLDFQDLDGNRTTGRVLAPVQ